ncbi:Uncharacterised protein [Vibrio cholerae]|nr:Uncharacterised protein [Vibrio cholerae]
MFYRIRDKFQHKISQIVPMQIVYRTKFINIKKGQSEMMSIFLNESRQFLG